MVLLIISAIVVTSAVAGVTAVVSKKRFNKRFEKIERDYLSVEQSGYQSEIDSLCVRANEYENFQANIERTISNIRNLQIKAPSCYEDGENNVKSFYDFINKYDKEITGTEQVLLTIVGDEQLVNCIVSFGDVLGNQLAQGVRDQISILKDGISNIDIHFDYSTLHDFFVAIGEYGNNSFHRIALIRAIEHHNYLSAGAKLAFAGLKGALEPSLHISENLASAKDAIATTLSTTHEQLSDVLSESFTPDTFDVSTNIPVGTMAISAIREVGLLSADMTDVNTAFKNAGIDIACVAAGGTAGKIAGGAIGTLVLPGAGTLVGAAVGSVVCGIAAKMFGNNIKAKPLKDAIYDYESTKSNMKNNIDDESSKSLSEVVVYINSKNEELKINLNSVTDGIRGYKSNDQIVIRLRDITHKCTEAMNDAYDSISGSIWYTKKYKTRMNKFTEDLRKLNMQEESDMIPALVYLSDTMRLLHVDAESKDDILQTLSEQNLEWEKLNNENNADLLAYSYSATTIYQNTIKDVEKVSIAKYNDLISKIESWNNKLTSKLNKVIEEQRKLGKGEDAPTIKQTLSNVGDKIDKAVSNAANSIKKVAGKAKDNITKFFRRW